MQTARAIAFWGQFEACVNGAFELRLRLRRERWGGRAWSDMAESKELGEVERKDDDVRVEVYMCEGRGLHQ